MIIYEFLYCCCIHESSYASLSLHQTKKGAIKAMKKHKADARAEFVKEQQFMKEKHPELFPHTNHKFGKHEHWDIGQQELLD